MNSRSAAVGIVLFLASSAQAGDDLVIATLDTLRFNTPKAKAKAELVEGKVGKAIRFSFDKDARSTFFTSNIRGTPAWDKAAGFSFWVKGDGTEQVGGLEFIYNDDFAIRYDYAFPIKGTDWTKVVVAWQDLVPILSNAKSKPLATSGGNPPSKLSALWVGKWWYWGDYPAQTFTLDEIRLEPKIDRADKDYVPTGAPLARVHAKLKAGQPIRVVTMGDSLTDYRHWANRKLAWPNLLQQQIKKKYQTDVTIINPAIGGTELRQNLALIPRWLMQAPEPDLVTICFGGNDWNSGMRGELFEASCLDAIDRVRRATHGKADVLLMTTVPGAANWTTMAELAEACRKAARARNAGLADTEKAFHDAGKDDRNRLYVTDRVHLSQAGHEVVAETALHAIEFTKQP